ncbi:G2-specific serine/threonine protein kinase [Paramecium bursaria]
MKKGQLGQVNVVNDKQIGKYDIIKVLSNQDNRRVIQVRDQTTNQILAIKEVSLSKDNYKQVEQALTEVREAFCDSNNKFLFIVMEYASVGTLREIYNSFNERELLKIVQHILMGLKLLHDNRIIHGDINLDNILVFSEGQLTYKLSDFDLSKCPQNKRDFEIEQIAYRSPETFACKITTKSDIWSLGCMLYHMVEGHPPFEAQQRGDLKRKIIHESVAKITNTSNQILKNLINKMLDKNPDSRPHCQQLLKDFYDIKQCDQIKQSFNLVDTLTLPIFKELQRPLATMDQNTLRIQSQNQKDSEEIFKSEVIKQLTKGGLNNLSFFLLKQPLTND